MSQWREIPPSTPSAASAAISPADSSGFADATLPAFRRIGSTFYLGKRRFSGMVIASPEVLYLGIGHERTWSEVPKGPVEILGAILAAVVGVSVDFSEPRGPVMTTCTVEQLPEQIRNHPQWPLRGKWFVARKHMILIRASHVESMIHPRFTNVLRLKTPYENYAIRYTPGCGGSVRNYLAKTGWTFTWCGRRYPDQ